MDGKQQKLSASGDVTHSVGVSMSDKKVTRIQTRRMGPQTATGRERALAARIRGKLPHSVMIVPGIESPEEWERFRSAIVTEYQAVGTVEIELAHRVAELLWRLRRFSRYETDCAAWRLKMAEVAYHRLRDNLRSEMNGRAGAPPLPAKPDDPEWLVRLRSQAIAALWYLDHADAPGDIEHGDGAPDFIRAAAHTAGVTGYRVRRQDDWTTGDVRRHLSKIAARAGTTTAKVLDDLFVAVSTKSLARGSDVSAQHRFYASTLSEFKRTLMLPAEGEIRNAARWESHLERSLCRTMDRLERLQRMRAGEVVPAPAIVRLERDDE